MLHGPTPALITSVGYARSLENAIEDVLALPQANNISCSKLLAHKVCCWRTGYAALARVLAKAWQTHASKAYNGVAAQCRCQHGYSITWASCHDVSGHNVGIMPSRLLGQQAMHKCVNVQAVPEWFQNIYKFNSRARLQSLYWQLFCTVLFNRLGTVP